MAIRQSGRKIYRSANGKNVDLDLLISRNELTPAVGNARVNARGDELGPGGKIVRKREDVLKDYYSNASGVVDEPVRRNTPKADEPVATVASATEEAEWQEDDEGNFIKKSTRKR